ncbi:hypothetical protein CPB84DRAFT_1847921 [Gymnopilus junonius]|uniref:PH domain-containing protein n=1 Tax=Gymnopilus junonius TaxID=109634 RepID=A0A9P5TMK8_GYMJU|nr:hypothetical protein CPB84DRAFT_1847921 [Gymnopilus junonius]
MSTSTSIKAPSVSSAEQGPSPSAVEPLYQVKLLSALRNGDPAAIHPFLAEIGKDKRKSVDGDIDTGAAALHLAVRCGSVQTVALLLSHRAISPNGIHPPGSGTTPLHLAASLGDWISYILSPLTSQPPQALIHLLESPRATFVDLSYLDNDAGTSLLHEAARRKDLRLIELAVRAGADVFVRNRKGKMAGEGAGKDERVRVFLRQFANHDKTLIPNPTPLTEPPVLRGYLNKYTNVAKGYNTRWFVLKNGVLSYYRHQDDETIAIQSSPSRGGGGGGGHASLTSPTTTSSSSGVQKWYMKANHPVEAHRWAEAIRNSIEWFKLKERDREGDRDKERESDASSISRSLRRRSGESDSSGAVRGPVVGTVGATPPLHGHGHGHGPVPPLMQQQQSTSTNASALTPSRASATIWRKTLGRASRDKDKDRDNRDRDRDSHQERDRDQDSLTPSSSSYAYIDSVDASPTLGGGPSLTTRRRGSSSSPYSHPGGGGGGDEDEGADAEGEEEDSASSSLVDAESKGPPHHGFELQGNAAAAQLELSIQLLNNLTATSGQIQAQAQTQAQIQSPVQAQNHAREMRNALKESLLTTQSLLNDYLQMSHDREEWWAKRVKKEKARQKFWEESLAVVVREGETLEQELRARSRRRGSRVFGPSVVGTMNASALGGERERRRPSLGGLMRTGSGSGFLQPSPVMEAQEPVTPMPTPAQVPVVQQPSPTTIKTTGTGPRRSGTLDTLVGPQDTIKQRPPQIALPGYPQFQAQPQPQPSIKQQQQPQQLQRQPQIQPPPPPVLTIDGQEPEIDTDEEDEFFDAIEANNLPNLVVYEGLKSPGSAGLSPISSPLSFAVTTPKGLKALPTDTEARVESELEKHPAGLLSLSLASAMSMSLQTQTYNRISLHLPHLKGVSVSVPPYAGYVHLRTRLGISNDQRPSTSLWSVLKHSIGKDLTKISFPVFFNEPTSMLQRMAEDMEFSECLDVAAHEKDPLRRIAFSETFEYVRLDRQYRYVSEQVSHHPPISACWAESTWWHYYGEVDAQNKFMGKSFEIRPTGVAHADLLLPEEIAPGYPKAKGEAAQGKVVEHYSWKKVTTNVSGFILGSPTIDHYGDMVITNHRTGDQCILTFKPRGWRGKDAYEISGQVIDAQGDVAYEIAGRWNSQLVAKKMGTGSAGGQLHPDISVPGGGPNSPSISPSPEYILLWRNSDKPPGSPFNLTPFAITLNDCPQDTLRPFLCPTDCRLRPDQRAFELGKYELANELKTAQEEKQRGMRKAREEGKMEGHRPRWFVAETEGDTGERVWSPLRNGEGRVEYWVERERVWLAGGGDKGRGEWKGVDDIFVEEPEVVRELRMK